MTRANPFRDEFDPKDARGAGEEIDMKILGDEMAPGGVLDATEKTPLLVEETPIDDEEEKEVLTLIDLLPELPGEPISPLK